MFRKQSQVFRDLNLAIDIIGLEMTWLLTYYLRFYWGPIPLRYQHIVPLQNYSWIFIFFPFIWIFAGMESGLYRTTLTRTRQIIKISRSLILSMLLIITISFLLKKVEYSRVYFSYFSILAFIFLIVHRWVWGHVLRLVSQSKFAKRAILIDCGQGLGAKLAKKMRSNHEFGINLLGWIPSPDNTEPSGAMDLRKMGEYREINQIIKDHSIQCVFICLPLTSSMTLEKIFQDVGKTLVDLVLVPDFHNYFILDQHAESIDEFPLFHLQTTKLVGWNLIYKRVFDFFGSIALLALFSPIFILIAAIIKLSSKGPAFYAQKRLGSDHKEFRMYKFRTMIENAEAETGPIFAERNDPRTTRIGRILRKTSLDELPNLINVFKGEMSLVGPRPEREYFFEKLKESNPLFTFRLKFKPGMTGWAQVNGLRQDSSFEKRLEHDIYYIQNWSFALDLKILFMTTWKGFYAPNAY